MKERRMSWRIGALSSVVVLVVMVLGAAAGQSALSGPSATTLVDGTTDSITNVDPAGNYDYGTFTLDSNVFEHLMDFRHGSKLEPSLATKCFSVGTLKTWRCTLRKGVDLQRRFRVRLDRCEVQLRSRDEQDGRERGGRQHAVVAARQPEERQDERQVRGDVQPQVAAGRRGLRSSRRRSDSSFPRIRTSRTTFEGTPKSRSGPARTSSVSTRRVSRRSSPATTATGARLRRLTT